ncbi:MAG: DnaJ domain-containing protein [Peptococcaceae bacterium]|nr:DnaJ domain-containing protein [Peptococcaceae bacterium]
MFHLLTWLFNYAYEKTYEEEYQERHRYYQYQREQREYRREYHREESQDDDYSVLGLSPGVTLTDIKAAYRRLVKKYHPDAGGDPEMFKRIHIAYQNIVTGR